MATPSPTAAFTRIAVAVVVVSLGTAGCADSGDDEVSTDSSTAETTAPDTTEVDDTTTTAVDAPTTAAPTTADTTPSSEPAPDAVRLTTDGVDNFVFGNPQDAVVEAMTAILGSPTETRGVECGSGSDTIVVFPGASFIFGAGTFAGWHWGGAETPVVPGATPEGITLGSTVAEAQAAFGADFAFQPESTLGNEFYVGTDYPSIGGFTTGTGPDDVIESLYGGDLCAFR